MQFRRSSLKRLKPLSALILPGVLLLFVARCLAASATTETATPESVKQGSAIFNKRCIVCHNKKPGDNTPFGPPNLYTAFHGHAAVTPQQAETIITHGRGQMPAFAGILSRAEIRSVITYLRKRSATEAPK
jgi:mono/diheme cytochrome c family protein